MLWERLGRWVVRRRGAALLIVLLVTALAGLGIGQRVMRDGLPVDFTPQAIFIDQGPLVERLREIEAVFGRDDNNLLLILEGEALASAEGAAALRNLHDRMAADEDVEGVVSLLTAPVLEQVDGALVAEPALDGGGRDDMPAALAAAGGDPYLRGLLVSADQRTTVLRVRLDPSLKRVAELAPVVERLTAEARAVPLPDGLRLLTTGVPFVRSEVVSMMLADEQFFTPVTALAFAVIICLLFRRVSLGLGPLVGVLGAIVWAMGVLLAAGATLNILSILVPVLVLVIGVADGIHVVSRYREELAGDGDREAAMGRALRHMTTACFLTTFTTAAGFASLLVADTRVIRDFGAHSALAVMVTFFGVMFILPVWLAFVPARRVGPPPTEQPSAERRLFAGLDAFVARRPATVLVMCLLLTAGAGVLGSGVRPNSRLLEMYHPDHPTWAAIKHTEQQLSGVVPVFIHLEVAAGEGDLLEPERMQRIAALQSALQSHDHVRWTSSLASLVSQIHTTLTEAPAGTLPDSREAAAQELLLAELSGELPLDEITTPDHTATRILALCADSGGREFVAMRAALQEEAAAVFADDPAVRVDVTGDGMLASVGIGGLIEDLLTSVGLVFVVILGVMWLTMRDLKLALLSALPNVLPLVFTLATLRLMGADLQVSNIVSFTVAVGLAVDDTIHFLVRFRQERDAGHSHKEAIRRTFLGAGHAIVLTSLLLVLGFALLSTSELTTTRHFGILSSATMTAAVLADLLLLPALLHLAAGSDSR